MWAAAICVVWGGMAPTAVGVTGASLSLSKDVGPPTTHVAAMGAGFGALERIRISFDGQRIATASTDNSGAFAKSVTVPREAQPGDHIITATGRNSGLTASATFTVQTDWLTFHFSAARTGLNPYENTLSKTNVSGLVPKWTAPLADLTGVSPAIAGGVVYEGDFASNLFAIDAATGHQLWQVDLGGGGITDPAVAKGTVYVGTMLHSSVVAVEAGTGVLKWERFLGGSVFGSPAVVGGVVYIGSNDGNLYALNADTGAQLWASPFTGAPDDPAVASGVVYVGGNDRQLYAFNAATGAQLWSVELEDIVESTPTVVDGVVYVGSSNMPPYDVYAIDAVSGAILWTTVVSGQVNSSPAVVNGSVYVNTFDGYLWAFEASTGKLKWSVRVGGCYSSPAVANGVVYVGSDDFNTYAVNANTGATLWSWATGDKVCSSPVITDGVLYVGSFDAKLYAFGLP